MTDILIGVVEIGSGRRAKIDGVSVAGKTGTAQKAEKGKGYTAGKEVMSFMGFLPADDPKIAIIVTIDEPTGARFSGQIAGPVFKRIAMQTLQHIEQTDFLDSSPQRRNMHTSRKYTDANRTTVPVRNRQLSNQPDISPPRNRRNPTVSDDAFVKKGEGL